MTSRKETSAASRFPAFVRIEETDACILWPGAKLKTGYGIMRQYGTTVPATHAALEANGRLRPSKSHFACHSCDNPSCVNPKHLFWGTHADNMKDQKAKGRHWATVKSNCAKGHMWSPENTRIGKDGRKNCRTCERDRVARRKTVRDARFLALVK